MQKYIPTLIVILVLIVGYVYFSQQEVPSDVELEASAAVEEKTHGVWDKELEVVQTNTSNDAVVGTWAAGDVWNWIGWKDGAEWKILVSLDGFDCDELETIRAEHMDFFLDVTHAPDGSLYCYSHNSR